MDKVIISIIRDMARCLAEVEGRYEDAMADFFDRNAIAQKIVVEFRERKDEEIDEILGAFLTRILSGQPVTEDDYQAAFDHLKYKMHIAYTGLVREAQRDVLPSLEDE